MTTNPEMTAKEWKALINGPTYRPENVILKKGENSGWVVLDFDGSVYTWTLNRDLAIKRMNVRKGVIKAALTRRANKARTQ